MTVVACFAAAPVSALSCQPWSHLHAWHAAAQVETLYLIVRGSLLFDETELPVTDWDNQQVRPQLTQLSAYLTGDQLGRNGFATSFRQSVTLEVLCYGPWCASAVSGESYVLFVELREQDFVVSINPCGGSILPAAEQIESDLMNCMRGAQCPNPEQ